MKTGLVLEGGSMRGMYTAGILDIFLDEEIWPDGIIGVSAGAIFAVNYVSRQRGRALRYCQRFNSDKDYLGLKPLLKEGNIFSTEYAYHRVPEKLDPFDDETYIQTVQKVPLYATLTRVDNGQAEYVPVKAVFPDMDVLRASGSMPIVSRPVNLNGVEYLDGGIADSIPYKKMLEMGYDRLIVILTRDASYVKEPMAKPLVRLGSGRHKEFGEALAHRHEMYNSTLEGIRQMEREHPDRIFVIRPSRPITLSKIERDPAKLQEVYDLGQSDIKAVLPDLLAKFPEIKKS